MVESTPQPKRTHPVRSFWCPKIILEAMECRLADNQDHKLMYMISLSVGAPLQSHYQQTSPSQRWVRRGFPQIWSPWHNRVPHIRYHSTWGKPGYSGTVCTCVCLPNHVLTYECQMCALKHFTKIELTVLNWSYSTDMLHSVIINFALNRTEPFLSFCTWRAWSTSSLDYSNTHKLGHFSLYVYTMYNIAAWPGCCVHSD